MSRLPSLTRARPARRSSPAMLLTDLPVDVLELITAHLTEDELSLDPHDHLLTGRALALVCRKTHQLGLGILYHRVIINNETDFNVLATLQSSSNARRHVVWLSIDWDAPGSPTSSTYFPVFRDLPRLRVLQLYGSDIDCAPNLAALASQASPDLREIVLAAHGPSNSDFPKAVVAFLQSRVNLEKLEVRFHDKWSGSFSSSRLAVLPPHVVLKLFDDFDAASWFSCLDASRLRSLQYFNFYAGGSTHVAFFNTAHNLEELTLMGKQSLLGDLLVSLLPHFSKMSRLRALRVVGCSSSVYTAFEVGDARRALVFSALPRTLEVVSIDIVFGLPSDPVDFRGYLNSQLQGGGRPGGKLKRWESSERDRLPRALRRSDMSDFYRAVFTRQVDQNGHEYFVHSRCVCLLAYSLHFRLTNASESGSRPLAESATRLTSSALAPVSACMSV